MKKIRTLSIDGGGVRGILPGIVLERLEKKLQKLESEILTASVEMDDGSVENLQKLKEDGLAYISKTNINEELDTIANKLVKYE
ncbi:MAG: hypothetical protein GKR88_18760 [Flavobacteriaceae bacterium]|nr:MAG: hypothetical protein GKR88_18760 [Flavobacteriaceae bacterium]